MSVKSTKMLSAKRSIINLEKIDYWFSIVDNYCFSIPATTFYGLVKLY